MNNVLIILEQKKLKKINIFNRIWNVGEYSIRISKMVIKNQNFKTIRTKKIKFNDSDRGWHLLSPKFRWSTTNGTPCIFLPVKYLRHRFILCRGSLFWKELINQMCAAFNCYLDTLWIRQKWISISDINYF